MDIPDVSNMLDVRLLPNTGNFLTLFCLKEPQDTANECEGYIKHSYFKYYMQNDKCNKKKKKCSYESAILKC